MQILLTENRYKRTCRDIPIDRLKDNYSRRNLTNCKKISGYTARLPAAKNDIAVIVASARGWGESH